MGRRGPPPKPSALKRLQGTYRPDRGAGAGEMAPPSAVPERPGWLDAEARREWDRIVPQLADLGVLADVDQAVLANYCAAVSLAVGATRAYQRAGLMAKARAGAKISRPHPMIRVAQEARAQARLLGAELGLSPASRSRVKAPEKAAEADPDEAFLFGGAPPLRVVDGGRGGTK